MRVLCENIHLNLPRAQVANRTNSVDNRARVSRRAFGYYFGLRRPVVGLWRRMCVTPRACEFRSCFAMWRCGVILVSCSVRAARVANALFRKHTRVQNIHMARASQDVCGG